MTVRQYMETRSAKDGRRKIRVINLSGNGGVSDWTIYADRDICKITITTKYVFLYVK